MDYKTNGEQWYGRQAFWGGSHDWGYRVGCGHRTGNDYETGSNFSLPSSYKSRMIGFAPYCMAVAISCPVISVPSGFLRARSLTNGSLV